MNGLENVMTAPMIEALHASVGVLSATFFVFSFVAFVYLACEAKDLADGYKGDKTMYRFWRNTFAACVACDVLLFATAILTIR